MEQKIKETFDRVASKYDLELSGEQGPQVYQGPGFIKLVAAATIDRNIVLRIAEDKKKDKTMMSKHIDTNILLLSLLIETIQIIEGDFDK